MNFLYIGIMFFGLWGCAHQDLSRSVSSVHVFNKYTVEQVYKIPAAKFEGLYLEQFKDDPNSENCSGGDGALLSEGERISICLYTQGLYSVLTPALYSGKLTPELAAHVRMMDAALLKIPSKKQTVFRGTAKHNVLNVGQIFQFKAFTSTSVSRDVAEGFIIDRLFIIKTISGKVIPSVAGQEKEILLPRGVKFKVEKIQTKKLSIFTEEGPKDISTQIINLDEI